MIFFSISSFITGNFFLLNFWTIRNWSKFGTGLMAVSTLPSTGFQFSLKWFALKYKHFLSLSLANLNLSVPRVGHIHMHIGTKWNGRIERNNDGPASRTQKSLVRCSTHWAIWCQYSNQSDHHIFIFQRKTQFSAEIIF